MLLQGQDNVCVSESGVPFEELKNPYTAKKWKFVFSFDGRKSSSLNQKTPLFGVTFGYLFKNKHKFGLGIFWFTKDPVMEDVYLGEGSTDTTDIRFNLGYLSSFYEYVWWSNMRWEITTPLHVSVSNLRVNYWNTISEKDTIYGNFKVPLIEPSVTAEYRLFRLISIRAGVGYRFMLTPDDVVRQGFSNFIYKFGVSVGLGEIWHMMNGKKEKHAAYNEYWQLFRCSEKNR